MRDAAYGGPGAMAPPEGLLASAKFSEVFVWVKNLRKMRAFYHETLGLPIAYENERFVELRTGGVPIALHSGRKAVGRSKPHWFLEVVVRDLDATIRMLRARGVTCERVREEPFGGISSFVDPEGNVIGLEESSR